MNKIILLTATMATLLLLANPGTADAQRHEREKKYWENQREQQKKRDEYYRERDKKQAEYYRERDKKEYEYRRESAKRRQEYWKESRKHRIPGWARPHRYDARHHVYFRDYDTFYDPYRGGYAYRQNGRWLFSVAIPSFLAQVDLGRARIQVMGDIPLNRHPEDYYDDYDEYDDDRYDNYEGDDDYYDD